MIFAEFKPTDEDINECVEIIAESSKPTKNQKRYKCPYCEYRDIRSELVFHINNEHEEMIPENYTSSRIVFNIINKRDHGSCMMCGKETKWDEDKGRYDSFDTDKCKADYKKMIDARMMKKYGKISLLNDEQHQEKMLAGRSISGTYTFSTGGTAKYVGSYERKFLEFIDLFLHIRCKDIISPGPTIPYKWKNPETNEIEEHFWITDFYYVPYNLVFDIKDGGDNPNNRNMYSYREKQKVKEDTIKELNKYNYIRLTDNKFDQLILLMMELKDNVIAFGDKYKPIIRINEYCSPVLGLDADNVIRPNRGQNIMYFIPTIKNGVFNLGISKDTNMMDMMFPNEEFKLESKGMNYLFNSNFKTYKFYSEDVDAKYYNLINNKDLICSPKFIYEYFTGKELLDINQINYDENLTECVNFLEELKMLEDVSYSTFKGTNISIPTFESTGAESNIEFAQDIDGYYCYNKSNDIRSKSYNEISDIPIKVQQYIERGIL